MKFHDLKISTKKSPCKLFGDVEYMYAVVNSLVRNNNTYTQKADTKDPRP